MATNPITTLTELVSRATPDFGVENVAHATDCREWVIANGAAVAELIEADRGYDAAKAHRIEADNRITSGDRSDDAFRRQANTHHAYDRAVDRRRAALARVQGGAA